MNEHDNNNPTYVFPQARLDEMALEAVRFDAADPRPLKWHFDGRGSHFDGAESAYLARQLEFMRPGVIEASFPKLMAANWIPYNTTPDSGSTQFTVVFEDQVGEVRLSQDMKGIIPRVDAKTSTASINIFSMLLSYGYSIQEARAAMKAGYPLQARRAMLCREQMERKLDDIAFVGDTGSGVKGLLNQTTGATAVDTYTVPATGQGGSKKWRDKAPDDVLLDLCAAPSQIVTGSLEIEQPDTWLLPLSTYESISQRRVGDGTNESILSYYLRTAAHAKRVVKTHKSETKGSGSTTRAVCYEANPNKLEMIVPTPFEQFNPISEGLDVVTICHLRTAGVFVYRPRSICYADDV